MGLLIVDDDPGICETMKDILEASDYCVKTVNSGYSAIELVKKQHFNTILMDMKMPGLNGLETFMQIQKIDPSSRVIFITAYTTEDLTRLAKEDVIDLMDKPINIPTLLEELKKSFKR